MGRTIHPKQKYKQNKYLSVKYTELMIKNKITLYSYLKNLVKKMIWLMHIYRVFIGLKSKYLKMF